MPKKLTSAASVNGSADSPESILQRLTAVDASLTRILEPVVTETQQVLNCLEGRSFGLEVNIEITSAIQLLLQRLGLRVTCVKCEQPGQIRCRATRNAKGGSFQFEHAQGKPTNHGGGTTFPKLQLIGAPPDSRRRRKKRA